MILATCQHETTKPVGKDRKGNQRIRCTLCGKYMVESGPKPLGDMRISMKDACLALGMLLEGMSIRSVERLTSLHRDTIDNLILVVGDNCQRFLEEKIQAVEAKDVQLDEIWSFVGMKEKTRVARGHSAEVGDSWTFIAIDRDTKLILAHQVGQRDDSTCRRFLKRLNRATVGRFQLSTDGLAAYTLNVPFTFGSPDPDKICTSHIERFNLTCRMTLRRFTRLTNAHSKSVKHHAAMQAIFFAFYNFCRKHETLKGATPAMAAGLAEKIWNVRELLEQAASAQDASLW